MLQQPDTALATWTVLDGLGDQKLHETLHETPFRRDLDVILTTDIAQMSMAGVKMSTEAVEWSSNESALGRVLAGMHRS